MRKTIIRAAALIGTMALLPAISAGLAATDVETYKELDQFMAVFERVKAEYVDKVDDKTLIKGAIDGMLASLDPHSSYLDARDFQNMRTQTEGNYGGLGLTVQSDGGVIKVVAANEDGPASKAGIKSGDYITNVDGKLIYGDSVDESVDKMKGPPGTSVRLTIVREGRDKPFDVTLKREIIELKAVKWEVKGRVGVININSFSKVTGPSVRSAIASIDKATGGQTLGYVVDLRSNPGGLLDQAVEVSDAFLNHGEIVSQRGREKTDIERYYARPGDDAHGLPVVVLVDGGTASAAEIVAGALQDQRRAVVLGTRSFGKGSVQTVMPLPGNGAMRLTTARYYTPSGRSIQGLGITPDVEVASSRTEAPRFGPEREADLRGALRNQGGASQPANPAPRTDLPPIVKDIPKLPPEGAPTFDLSKPDTDFQLKEAVVVVQAMAQQKRASR